jgi:hypothetical protein
MQDVVRKERSTGLSISKSMRLAYDEKILPHASFYAWRCLHTGLPSPHQKLSSVTRISAPGLARFGLRKKKGSLASFA